MDELYRIRVRGHLDDRWADWFGGLDLQRQDDGTTVLVGPIVDQAALHGVLARIRDLGLPLLEVTGDRGHGKHTAGGGTPPGGGGGADGPFA
jgi:hypothetical protein